MSNQAAVPEISLSDRWRAARRHRGLLLTALSLGVGVTLLLVLFLPPTYRASATILIEQQEIPQDLVRSTITSFADQRVQVISQRVMTSQNLMAIVERYNLYPWLRRTRAREAVIERMRDDVRMRLISANVMDPRYGRPMQATIAFTVSYDSGSPDLAVKVASELTSLYLNENLTIRTAAAQQTATFLGAEAEHLRADIQTSAAKIAAYKKLHPNSLPDLAQANFQLLDRTELELRDVNNQIASLDQQRVMLEAQLAQLGPTSQIYSETGQRILSPADRLKTLKADLASLKARYGADHPDIAKTEREIAGLQSIVSADGSANDLLRKLDSAKAELGAAREHYSAEHPDVKRLERTVAALEEQVQSAPASERVRAARTNPDNPAYIQLSAQVEGLIAQRAAQVRKAAELQDRLDDFERRLSQSPEVEKEYRALMRDYDAAQLKYQEVRLKHRDAESAQNLETERKGERFTLIEPPLPPEQPVSPNRPAVFILGLLASLAITFVALLIRDATDPSVRGARDLLRLIDVPPLAQIPVIDTPADLARRARVWRYSWQGSLAGLALAVVLVHLLLRPLDILWWSVLRRFGF